MPDPRTPPRKRHRSKGPGSPRPPALRKPVQGERERGRPKERSVKVDPVPTEIPDKKQKVKKEKKEKDKKEEKSDKKREGSKKRAGEKKEAKGEGKREKRDKKGKKEKKDKKDKKEKKKGTKKNVKKESKKRRSDEKSDAKRIKYVPCVKEKIEHIFDDKGDSRADEGCSEATTRSSSRVRSTTSMSSKEKAEQKLRELTAIMGDSDHDESEEVTDEEELLAMGDEVNAEGAEEEDSDEEAEEMGSEEEEDKEEDEGNSSEESGDEAEDDDEGETSGESEEEKDDNKEEKEREQEEKKKLEHALVPVVKTSQESVQVMRNSMTNKKEWDTFTRQAKTKMPIALNDTYQASKTELFNMWLDSNYSWSACALAVERKHQESNTAKKGWKAIQGKELKNRYTAEKWEQVKKKRLEQGLYYKDDDFPDDDDETWYFVKEGESVSNKVEVQESMTLAARLDMDENMRQAITNEENGLMKVGALPKVSVASTSGNKALMEAIGDKVSAPAKRKPKKEEEKPESVTPLTWVGKGKSTLPEVLKAAADCRTASLKLAGMEYAQELAGNLLKQAEELEKHYKLLAKHVNNESEKDVKLVLGTTSTRLAAVEQAQAAAAAFLKKPNPKKKAKGTKDGKEKK
ncbi:unnamed protein product [Durusdinium trenchii]|uniref:Myb-like domain-containing protein n=1 Tax=Durusdinium trenchii TaxID=1381693 RepID=A0ABP0QLT7_9DINO